MTSPSISRSPGGFHKLLPLVGAPVMIKPYGGDRVSLNLNMTTQDPKTGDGQTWHSARARALAEAPAPVVDSGAKVVRRTDLNRSLLQPFGLDNEEQYIVLHTGARIKFTQWPYYAELAAEIVTRLGLRVVFFSDGDASQAGCHRTHWQPGRSYF